MEQRSFQQYFKEKLEIEEKLKELNLEVIKKGMNNERYLLEKDLISKQEIFLAKEEVFWRQKSREKWLDERDQNTKFFHNSTLHNRDKSKIVKIKDRLSTTTEDLINFFDILVNHFQCTLNNYDFSNKTAQTKILEVIPKVVSLEDNKILNKPITLE